MADHGRILFTPYTSEAWRMSNMGPGLIALILLGVISLLLWGISHFLAKPGTKSTLRLTAFAIILIPILFFSLSTYESNAENLSENREYDNTFAVRVGVVILGFFTMVGAMVSYIIAQAKPMQGRRIIDAYSTKPLLQGH